MELAGLAAKNQKTRMRSHMARRHIRNLVLSGFSTACRRVLGFRV